MRSLLVGLVVLVAVSPARADVDIVKADAVFEEGQKLKDAGQLDQACAKFKESLGYNPNAVGVILNVALCDQQSGRIGSAMKLFKEARDRGKEQSLTQHTQLAEQHIAEIEADVPYLAVVVAEHTEDTKLVIDNEVIPLGPDGSASIPVDPFELTVIVSRPGRVPFETKLKVERKEHRVLSVPKLKLPVTVTVNQGRKRIGQILTFSGAGLLAAGVGLGIYADVNYNSYFGPGKGCESVMGTKRCNAGAPYDNTNRDITIGWVGTGLGAAGIVVAGVGGYLWLFGPKEEKLAFAPRLDGREAGIVAFGRW
jgi:hypothetical protein